MRLSLAKKYLSIGKFPQVNLPDFTLITGLNGSGKTHLLRALESGHVEIEDEGSPYQPGEVRFFDWASIVPQSASTNPTDNIDLIVSDYRAAINNIQNLAIRQPFGEAVERFPKLRDRYGQSAADYFLAGHDELAELLGNEENALEARSLIDADAEPVHWQQLDYLPQEIRRGIHSIAERCGKPFFALSDDELRTLVVTGLPSQSAFQQSFSRLFTLYRDRKFENKMGQLYTKEGLDKDHLTDEQFEELHGMPPWIFVNHALEVAKLPFRIKEPDHLSNKPYVPLLVRTDTGVEQQIETLSSGEKVILSFAFCIYFSSDNRQITNYPKVILLDEVDATLHPSMAKLLLDIIQKTLVESCGVKVIATTHSPSTVALSPESSIFVMQGNGGGLVKRTKSEALNALTDGVPTLALSFEGRRQVFVESDIDAEIYSALYDIMNMRSYGRSLEFVGVGKDKDGGCDRVKSLVSSLVSNGNKSVFGLLDWDGQRVADERIHVMAEAKWHSLENLVFDPLIVAAAVCREFPDQYQSIGLATRTNWRQFATSPPDVLQTCVRAVTSAVFGDLPSAAIGCSYAGGFVLSVDERARSTRGHDWQGLVLGRYPMLLRIANSNQDLKGAALLRRIVMAVVSDCPEFLPAELGSSFEKLLLAPAH